MSDEEKWRGDVSLDEAGAPADQQVASVMSSFIFGGMSHMSMGIQAFPSCTRQARFSDMRELS